MPNIDDLTIRSLTGDNPRIDAVVDPKEPCVDGPVAAAGDLPPEAIAKLASDKAAEKIGKLIDELNQLTAELGAEDPEVAKAAADAAQVLAGGLARRTDGPAAEAPMAEALAAQALSVRTVEAGRVMSGRNLERIRAILKALTSAMPVLKALMKANGATGGHDVISACAEACAKCAAACAACAESMTPEAMKKCAAACVACAKACVVCAHHAHENGMHELAAACDKCAEACTSCGTACASGTVMKEQCAACSVTCQACEKACRGAVTTAVTQEAVDLKEYERIAESVTDVERLFEAVEITGHEIVEPKGGALPFIRLKCIFAKAGRSLNIDAGGMNREYEWPLMKSVHATGAYDGKPVGKFHASKKEWEEYGDEGIVNLRRVGRTGSQKNASWANETARQIEGYVDITQPAEVEQARAELAAGHDIRTIFPGVSHDIRSKSVVSKTDTSTRKIVDYRVVALDLAQTPALGGLIERQMAAVNVPKEITMADKTPLTVTDELARIKARDEAIVQECNLAKSYGCEHEAEFKRWTESLDIRPDIATIREKVTTIKAGHTKAASTSVSRDTESRVTAGADRIDRLRAGLIGYFDPKGYVRDKDGKPYGRDAESFSSYGQFLRSALSGSEYMKNSGEVPDGYQLAAFGSSALYHLVRQKTEDRKYEACHWGTDEQRDTETFERCSGLSSQYKSRLAQHTDERFAEAVLSSGIPQLTGDVKHLVALKAYASEMDGHDATFPPLDLFISEERTVDDIGETHRFVRYMKLGANEAAAVAEGAAYTEGSNQSDEEESGQLGKRGFFIDVAIEAISRSIAFDLIKWTPTLMGESLGAEEYRAGTNFMTANPNLGDGNAIASAAHANLVTTALSYANVSTLLGQMRRQTAYSTGTGANRIHLPVVGKHLITADAIYASALELFTHDTDPRTGNRAASAVVNPGTPRISIWSLPLLDSASNADDYFVIADKSLVPIQARLRWSGQPKLRVFEASSDENGIMLTNDLHRFKGRNFRGFVPLDYRGVQAGIVP